MDSTTANYVIPAKDPSSKGIYVGGLAGGDKRRQTATPTAAPAATSFWQIFASILTTIWTFVWSMASGAFHGIVEVFSDMTPSRIKFLMSIATFLAAVLIQLDGSTFNWLSIAISVASPFALMRALWLIVFLNFKWAEAGAKTAQNELVGVIKKWERTNNRNLINFFVSCMNSLIQLVNIVIGPFMEKINEYESENPKIRDYKPYLDAKRQYQREQIYLTRALSFLKATEKLLLL